MWQGTANQGDHGALNFNRLKWDMGRQEAAAQIKQVEDFNKQPSCRNNMDKIKQEEVEYSWDEFMQNLHNVPEILLMGDNTAFNAEPSLATSLENETKFTPSAFKDAIQPDDINMCLDFAGQILTGPVESMPINQPTEGSLGRHSPHQADMTANETSYGDIDFAHQNYGMPTEDEPFSFEHDDPAHQFAGQSTRTEDVSNAEISAKLDTIREL